MISKPNGKSIDQENITKLVEERLVITLMNGMQVMQSKQHKLFALSSPADSCSYHTANYGVLLIK